MIYKKIVLLALIVGVGALPPVWETICSAAALLESLDVGRIKAYILSFGVWAPVISFLLMIFQSVVAPLPAFLITFANAALFGWVWGAVLSWSSAMAGAIICFYIARFLGQKAAEKLTSQAALKRVDTFFERQGKYAILIARLLPFVSFDIVSYAAGLTSIRAKDFLIATGIGQLPATLIYSYAGEMLTGEMGMIVTGLLCLFAFSVFAFVLRHYYYEK